MKEQLQEALVAVKNGEETRARAILAGLLKDQPDNVPAWVLLSKLAQTEVQKAAFLRKVLQLDPDNQYATVELSALEGDAEATEPAEPVIADVEADEAAEVAAAEAEAVPSAGAELVSAPETKLPPPAGAVDEEPPAEEPSAPETELPEADAAPAEVTEEMETPASAMPISADPHDYEAQAEADTLPPWLADDETIREQDVTGAPASGAEPPSPIDVPDWLQEEPEPAWTAEEEQEAAPLPASTPRPVAAVEVAETTPAASQVAEQTPAARPPAPEPVPETTRAGLLIGLGILLIIVFLLLVYTALNFF